MKRKCICLDGALNFGKWVPFLNHKANTDQIVETSIVSTEHDIGHDAATKSRMVASAMPYLIFKTLPFRDPLTVTNIDRCAKTYTQSTTAFIAILNFEKPLPFLKKIFTIRGNAETLTLKNAFLLSSVATRF